MAVVLNFPQPHLLRSISSNRRMSRRPISIIRASSEPSPISSAASTASSSSNTGTKESQKLEASFTAPPGFKPPEPKRFAVRPDKAWDVIGASIGLLFRLGTGVFVSGYSASFVTEDQIPPNQYSLEVFGRWNLFEITALSYYRR
uniref:Uncharacterized protein n=1 Tax=Rhizophora mucronata TaxID=61149 RepID=A0A2P2LAI9_RHIMU